MAIAQIQHTVTLTTLECGQCGTVFAMSEDLQARRLEDHESFFCPLGHERHYPGKSAKEKQIEKLKTRLEWAEKGRDAAQGRADTAERSRAAVQGHLTRTKKRLAGGACPCCKRSFANLGRHMKTKHPGYVTDQQREKDTKP